MLQAKVVEKIKTHFCVKQFIFPSKSCRLWHNVVKHCTAGQTTDGQYGACALHAGYLTLQTHTQNT